jgi:hypothetical protein
VPCQLAVALSDLAAGLAQHRVLMGGGTLSGGERIKGLGQVPGFAGQDPASDHLT